MHTFTFWFYVCCICCCCCCFAACIYAIIQAKSYKPSQQYTEVNAQGYNNAYGQNGGYYQQTQPGYINTQPQYQPQYQPAAQSGGYYQQTQPN